jgi:hypothetical protein
MRAERVNRWACYMVSEKLVDCDDALGDSKKEV